jgi:hypothetical protein
MGYCLRQRDKGEGGLLLLCVAWLPGLLLETKSEDVYLYCNYQFKLLEHCRDSLRHVIPVTRPVAFQVALLS